MFIRFTINQFLLSNFHIGHMQNMRDRQYNMYLMFTRDGIDIINTIYNMPLLRRLLFVLTTLSYRRKKILFISENASIFFFFINNKFVGHPYVSIHWRPGLLSNFRLTRRAVARIRRKAFGRKSYYSNYLRNKKAVSYRAGVMHMRRLPDFTFFCTAAANTIAILEAKTFQIPTSGVIDTNGSPYALSYPIFGNDDSFYSLTFILGSLFGAFKRGIAFRSLFFMQRVLGGLISTGFSFDMFRKLIELKGPFRFKINTNLSLRSQKRARVKIDRYMEWLKRMRKFVLKSAKKRGRQLFFLRAIIDERRLVSFNNFIAVIRFFVTVLKIRKIILLNLLDFKFSVNADYFLFFIFLMFKMDKYSRKLLLH
jgi:ribosomal protein S2